VSFFNGNFSPTDTEGGALGAFMVGLTGSGNSNQFAGLVSNIFNPQGTFGGFNSSENDAASNTADVNGNYSPNNVSSPSGVLPFFGGNNTILGQLGSGTANQIGNGNGNILNNQFRLFTAFTQPQQQAPAPVVQQTPETQTPETQTERLAEFTNAQVGDDEEQGGTGTGTGSGTGSGPLLDATNQTTAPAGPRPLGPIGQRVADAVKNTSNAIKGALGLNKPKGTGGTSGDPGDTDNDSTGG